MSLAKNFQKQLFKELNIHAAWFPVANTFRVGTYGLIQGGVLQPIGHLTEDFGIQLGEPDTRRPASPSSSNPMASRPRILGRRQIDALPQVGDVDAKLTFKFNNKDSVLFRVATLEIEAMRSVQAIAAKLGANAKWRRAFRVVSAVYRTDSPVILLASEAGTEISFNANVAALKALEGGSVNGSVTASSSSDRSLDFVGTPGIVGLKLFKLGLLGGLKLLGPAQVEHGESWGADLDDDLLARHASCKVELLRFGKETGAFMDRYLVGVDGCPVRTVEPGPTHEDVLRALDRLRYSIRRDGPAAAAGADP